MINLFSTPFFKAKGLERHTTLTLFAFFTIGLSLLAVFQDFLQSNDNDRAFYFSESLLFRSFWILALPTVPVQFWLFAKHLEFSRPINFLIGVATASFIHLLLFSGLVNLLSALLFDHTYTFGRVFYYSITEDLYKYVLIYSIAAGTYLYWPVAKREEPVQQPARTMTIQNGRQYITLAVQDIHYIQAASPYILICTANEQHLHTASLKSILNGLDETLFVRIHKSAIVNLNEVAGYQSRLNGDYDIQLKNGTKLRLSRNYAPAFRKHIS